MSLPISLGTYAKSDKRNYLNGLSSISLKQTREKRDIKGATRIPGDPQEDASWNSFTAVAVLLFFLRFGYSHRIAVSGSILDARHAGTQLATIVTIPSRTLTAR